MPELFLLGSEAAETGVVWSTAIYTLVAFMVLLFLLKKFALGPLMGVMKEREDNVKNDIEAAEKSREETAALLAEQRNIMKSAQQEALANIEASRKQGEVEREQILTQARQEAERISENAKREIENEKEQAIAALRNETAQLSVLIASKIMERELNGADQKKLVDEMLKEAGEKNE